MRMGARGVSPVASGSAIHTQVMRTERAAPGARQMAVRRRFRRRAPRRREKPRQGAHLLAPLGQSRLGPAAPVQHAHQDWRIDARIHEATNPRYHALLTRFKAKTGCPVLVNTSFNVRGEPIICTPEDAFRCFMGSELDMLVVGNCILEKTEQVLELRFDYQREFELD